MIPFVVIALALAQGSALSSLPEKYRPKWDPTEVILKVDGVSLTKGEMAVWLWTWRGHEAIEEGLQYLLVERDAAKQNVTLGAAEADAEFAKRMAQVKANLQGKTFEEVLRDQGYSESRLYARLRTELLTNKVLDQSFHPEEFVKVSTIVFPNPDGSLEGLQSAIAAANAAYTKLKAGAKWDLVLAETKPAPAVTKSQGLIGWRPLELFPESVRESLGKAQAGELLKPVQTNNGIQIFRVERTGARATAEDLAEIRPAYLQTARPAYWKRLRDAAKIETAG